jgi:hypothetical protein
MDGKLKKARLKYYILFFESKVNTPGLFSFFGQNWTGIESNG